MTSARNARDLLRGARFPGDESDWYALAASGASYRREMIARGGEQSRAIAAALEIQRLWRGHRTRKKFRAILSSVFDAAASMRGMSLVMRGYQDYLAWCLKQGVKKNSRVLLSFEGYCAILIQHWWRRIVKAQMPSPNSSKPASSQQSSRIWTEETASIAIQRTWRSYSDRKVFKFYRRLINFHEKVDPVLMLRTTNPIEAQLMDKAAGSFVRFRLGGSQFPPVVYYKIFTSKSVVDMCAFSPRDYTAMAERWKLARDVHNHCPRTVQPSNRWYTREENNGWRPMFHKSCSQDAVQLLSPTTKTVFHHSKLRRKADMERQKKLRKIEWMKKMYQQGCIKMHKTLPEETRGAVNEALQALVDTKEEECVEDSDLEELLRWTNSLNYEEYVEEWSGLASTAVSS